MGRKASALSIAQFFQKVNISFLIGSKNAKFSANFSIHKLTFAVNNNDRAATERLNDIDKRAAKGFVYCAFSQMNGT
jgi:hypothetical protein